MSGSRSPALAQWPDVSPTSKSSVEHTHGTKTFPGAELVAGKGKATPMPAAVEERLIRLWASPQGAPKAAMAGDSGPTRIAPRPGQRIPADVMTAGKTSVAWEGNKPVVTFPIPGVPGATATATLDAKFMAERVVVKQGSNTTEFTYSDYRDWNNPLNKIEVFYAGKMTEQPERHGRSRSYDDLDGNRQVYVVMPVPASVKAAIKVTTQPPGWTHAVPARSGAAAEPIANAAAGQREAGLDGQLELPPLMNRRYGTRRCGPTQVDCTTRRTTQTDDE